jgi:hypothetical protein
MSHNKKTRRESAPTHLDTSSANDTHLTAKPAAATPKLPDATPGREDSGLTWQPMFVLVLIGLGFLVLLVKVLGLF